MSITWHPTRMQDCYMTENEKKVLTNLCLGKVNQIVVFGYVICPHKKAYDGLKNMMSSFKFGQIEVASKDFHKQR